MAKAFVRQVLSANRVGDGRVVFLARDGATWSEDFLSARVLSSPADVDAAMAIAAASVDAHVVLDVASVDIAGHGDAMRPVSLRDVIRASLRPTVAPRMPEGFALDTTAGGGI